MGYKVGHNSSTQSGKCIICNKLSGTFLEVAQYKGTTISNQVGSSVKIPVCDEHFNLVSEQKDILIKYAKITNNLFEILRT